MTPYYQHGGITIYHGDFRDLLDVLLLCVVMVTDPPYGIAYSSNRTGADSGSALPGIEGDADTSLRDAMLSAWGTRPAVVFGSWKRPRPLATRALLTWDKGDHVGMGDLSMPWKPNTEEIYILGDGFAGHRDSSVLRFPAPVSWNSMEFGRVHPHEKPVALMRHLLKKCPPGSVCDPFAGSGSTLRAAKDLGRAAVGVDVEERNCEIAARSLSQEVLFA